MAKDDAIWALGCMSGTSMDGVDAAMVLTDGVEVFEFGATGFRPYSDDERDTIACAQGQWPGGADVGAAATVSETAHTELIGRFGGVALVGFHGQTLAHDPANARTHQAGDGAALAQRVGHAVAWDFRSNDVALGGQGAPLAPFYHFALAERLQLRGVAFLNLGGVGNVTFIDPSAEQPDATGALLAFDTGPANALIDDFIKSRTGLACDYGGAMAAAGQVDNAVVSAFMAGDYFNAQPPKSLDRNDFSALLGEVSGLNDLDGAATLTACTIAAVKRAFNFSFHPPSQILVCGGGRKNDFVMSELSRVLSAKVVNIDTLEADGDMLEAQAFAYLAVRVQRGMTLSAPGTTGVEKPALGGRISTP